MGTESMNLLLSNNIKNNEQFKHWNSVQHAADAKHVERIAVQRQRSQSGNQGVAAELV